MSSYRMRLSSLGSLFRTGAQKAFNRMTLYRFSKAKEIQEYTVSKKKKKIMTPVLWNYESVILVNLLFSKIMVNSESYEDTLQKPKFHIQPIFPYDICMKCSSPMPLPSHTLLLVLLMPFFSLSVQPFEQTPVG
jgi:hypothetical protein